MFDRMPPEKLAKAKGQAQQAGEASKLARAANGHGVTGAERRKAEETLVRTFGKRKAAQLKENELLRAGARPKGLRKWFG
ncbi:hypothetical protein [Nonomuraea rubra]|jgi:hypothetical protein|uniref:Uncharacterized protein n=1 Tax=Nonomuraea rubra TaxID=46180 RepID=A0A7X0U5P0_9ACTN|nr:hypothetical protein [Nonomuraea rubra]MBB6556111.1 hypothetical protein [Nonomuraea rubra]